jgi:Glycine rich protein
MSGSRRGARLALTATAVAAGLSVGVSGASGIAPCGTTGVFSQVGATGTCTYTSTGEDTFTVPTAVSAVHVVAVGGHGASGEGGSAGGFGATVASDLAVSPPAVLYVEVGGNSPGQAGGANSGGPGGAVPSTAADGGGGGGASDLRTSAASAGLPPDTRLLVAGGGGGGGSSGAGAGAGGNAGSAGSTELDTGGFGGAGAPPGGSAGSAGLSGEPGQIGAIAAGGEGGGSTMGTALGGGGGGSGYYGGGGGGSDTDSAGGGGGGSSFSSGTATTITTDSTDVPLVKISWTITSAAVATSLTAAPQIDFRAPRLGVGVGKVSATLTSAGSPVAGQQITFTIGTTTLCTASTHSNGVAYCTLSLWNELRVLFANGYKASFVGNSAFLASHASTPAVIL